MPFDPEIPLVEIYLNAQMFISALCMPGMYWEQPKCPVLVKHKTEFSIFSLSVFLPRPPDAVNASPVHTAVQVRGLGAGISFYFFFNGDTILPKLKHTNLKCTAQ